MSKSAKTKSTKTVTKKAVKKVVKKATKAVAKPTKPAAKTPTVKKKTPPPPGLALLGEGAPAPTFSLPRDGGGNVSLADFAGRKLVIFFYPRADTPGCTLEAIDFTRRAGEFAAAGTGLLGVSADPVKAQDKFRDKHKLTTPLLSDETHDMLDAYGAWGEKSMYGKIFEGVLRTTVLIGKDGRIAQVWRGVKVDGHADVVLQAARAL